MLVFLIGMELKWFNDQRHYTNNVVKSYIFPQFSCVFELAPTTATPATTNGFVWEWIVLRHCRCRGRLC